MVTMKYKHKYKIGDEVILTSKRPTGWNPLGKMDKFLGKVVVITGFSIRGFEKAEAFTFTGSGGWIFLIKEIDPPKRIIKIW